MKFKTLMLIKAAVCLFFGILLLLQPNQLLNLLGATVGEGGLLMARVWRGAHRLFDADLVCPGCRRFGSAAGNHFGFICL